MKIGIIGFIILFLVAGCRTAGYEKADSRILVVKWPPAEPHYTHELIDSLEYISLEVSDSALFGHIMACSYTPEKFFILGNESDRNIKVFDASGKYLNSIGAYGRGPGEYMNVFSWSVKEDSVFIGDFLQNKLLVYRDNGQLLLEKQFPDGLRDTLGGRNGMAMQVHPLENGYFIHSKGLLINEPIGRVNDWVILDRQMQLKSLQWTESEEDVDNNKDLVVFTSRRHDTLFMINREGALVRKIFIDFGKDNLTPELRSSLSFEDASQLRSFVIVARLTGDYILMDIQEKGKRVRGVLNWKNGKIYLNDDTADNRHKILNFAATSSEEPSVVAFILNPKNPGFRELPVELQTTLEEDGGAVLVKYKLKKDL